MTDTILFFQIHPVAFVATVFVLGLIVGSFLNVVIHRLPLMMETSWRNECEVLLKGDDAPTPAKAVSLLWPPSCCPQCDQRIRARDNVPVLSYLFLRGRCRGCGKRISPRYPIIELISAFAAAAVAWRFGVTVETAAALALTWSLIVLTMIDFDHQLLPDSITLPLLWLGLLLSLGDWSFSARHEWTPAGAIIGAAVGYLSLWSVYHIFRLITGKEGMGYGDFKLLAVFGAWLGWQSLPLIILLSSLVGAVVGISLIVLRGRDRNIPIPFGPYLAAAGWLALMWQQELVALYFQLAR